MSFTSEGSIDGKLHNSIMYFNYHFLSSFMCKKAYTPQSLGKLANEYVHSVLITTVEQIIL